MARSVVEVIQFSTPARVALLGNPGDGYGGRVLAFTVRSLAATVAVEPADTWDFGAADGSELLQAAANQLHLDQPARMSFTTTIPRQVGLSGSSAIVVSAMRALLALDAQNVNSQNLNPVNLAKHALEAETKQLGSTAGPQDRVIQTHGGFMDMDFAQEWDALSYHRLDPGLLPPDLFIAWDTQAGEDSGQLHKDMRAAWEAGDTEVRQAIARFRQYAVAGWAALQAGDRTALANLMDANYNTRSELWKIQPTDLAKVAIAREHDAGVKFCGSGGAVVGVPRNPSAITAIQEAYQSAGFAFLLPKVGEPQT